MATPDAEVLYRALISDASRLRSLRRLQYRCDRPQHCLLLDAIEVPGSVLLHQKRFKNSPAINLNRSNEAGRAANTFDGENHWRPRTYYIGQSALSIEDDRVAGQSLQCDHVGVLADRTDLMLRASEFWADWHRGHADVRVRSDGSTYAVI